MGLLAQGGRGLPYDETPGWCARCGAKTVTRVDTDGMGHLVEIPGPCHACGRGVHVAFGLPFKRHPGHPKIAPAPRPTPRACRAEVRAALLRGVPIRVITREVGTTREMVIVVRHALEGEGRTLTCRCGKPAFHIGRCRGSGRENLT